MEHHFLILSNGNLDIDRALKISGHGEDCHCECFYSKHISVTGTCCGKISVACINLQSPDEDEAWNDDYIELNEYIARHFTTDKANTNINSSDTERAALIIHSLADKLKTGANLTIVWDIGNDEDLDIRNHLELLGALQRLVEWHKALVYLMCSSEDCEGIEEWMEMLQAVIVLPSTDIPALLWHGSVDIDGTKSSISLGGFAMVKSKESVMHCKAKNIPSDDQTPVMIDQRLEIISTVVRTQIPLFYISDKKYTFQLLSNSGRHQHSQEFLRVLHENTEICHIARLKYGSGVKKLPAKPDSWQDAVIKDPKNLTDFVEHLEFEGVGYIHFMLQGNCDNEDSCIAMMLQPPSFFNGGIMHDLALKDLLYSAPSSFSNVVEDWIKNAPITSADQMIATELTVHKAQLAVVTAWTEQRQRQDGVTDITVEELLSLLELTRTEVMQNLHPWTQQQQQQPDVVYPLPQPVSDCKESSSTDIEMLAQLFKEKQQGNAKNPTSEILAGFSPPTKTHQVTLDAAEIIKLFNKDGTAAATDLEPIIRTPSRRLLRFDSCGKARQHDKWPASFINNTHGKHYHDGEEAEILEKVCNKLKARLQSIETLGFFMSPSASIAATRTKAKHTRKTPTKYKPKRSKALTKSPAETPKRSLRNQAEADAKDKTKRRSTESLSSRSRTASQTGQRLRDQSTPRTGQPTLRHQTDSQSATRSQTGSQSASRSQVGSQSASRSQTGSQSASRSQSKTNQESRSQRHKRKLEETVRITLEKNGVKVDDPIFKSVSRKLFDLVKCYLKGLKTSYNLKQEMMNLAEAHVEQVIAFEKKYR